MASSESLTAMMQALLGGLPQIGANITGGDSKGMGGAGGSGSPLPSAPRATVLGSADPLLSKNTPNSPLNILEKHLAGQLDDRLEDALPQRNSVRRQGEVADFMANTGLQGYLPDDKLAALQAFKGDPRVKAAVIEQLMGAEAASSKKLLQQAQAEAAAQRAALQQMSAQYMPALLQARTAQANAAAAKAARSTGSGSKATPSVSNSFVGRKPRNVVYEE